MTKLFKHFVMACLVVSANIQAVELEFFTWRAQEKALWQTINQQRLIPGVTVNVKVVSYESYKDHILLNLQNNQVDLFQWAPGASSLQPLIDYGFIAPNSSDLNNINASARLASLAGDGALYGVPFALQLQAILVNKKLLEKHNLNQTPQTLNQLEVLFDSLKSKGITPLHLAGNENWYLSQLLAEVLLAGVVDEAFAQQLITGEQCFTDPRYQAIFELLAKWQQSGFINNNAATENYAGAGKSVALGNSAMVIDGGWRTNPASVFYSADKNFKFGFWPIPGKSSHIYALGDGSYQVNAKSNHGEAANKVLAFTATKQFAELFANTVGEIPAYAGSLNIDNPVLQRMSLEVAQNAYSVSLFNAFELNKGTPSYRELVINAFKGLIQGKMSPSDATKSIQEGLNSWQYKGALNCN